MTRPDSAPARHFPYLALFTVALAVFLSVTIEMLPTGLLSQMGDELGVSNSLVGLTVSVFAFTVVLTSAALTHLTRRVNRHTLVVTVLAVLAIATLLTGLAPNYPFLIAARIFGGVAHGIFWAVVGAYSAYLVPKEQIGRAVSISLGGGSLAFVLGVPLGTALGQAIGWRGAFVTLAVLTLLGTALVYRFLPRVAAGAETPTDSVQTVTSASGSVSVVRNPTRAPRPEQSVAAVVAVCLITALVMIGHYGFYTYVEPFLTGPMGVDLLGVSPSLFGYGIAGTLSLVIVATVFAARPRLGLVLGLAALALIALALTLWPGVLPLSLALLVLWGLSFGLIPPLLQTRILHVAPARIRDTASAFYTTAFNTGIGGGALLGSIALREWGVGAAPAITAVLVAAALLLTLATDAALSRQQRRRVFEH
ncbi:MFS transporter [Salinibacterium sp. SYSU T00001]|uniref:MFS transporter n=1 Tax=Homoserinimonas sedimenticola TaxID=2986805 RepID=UPI002236589D|nr:MFS transporter [Salinibacterium sedimenticola]MCW4386058.1 MFS transporter [Salinibacterium sedimenticola]